MKSSGAPSGVPLGNFLTLGTGEVLARCIAFLATTLVARRLGPDVFGILGFAAALTGYLVIAASTGLQDLAAREVARRPQEASRIAAGIVRYRLWVGLAGLLIAGIVALILPKPATVRVVVALSALSLLPLALNTAWAYKALERTRRVGASLLLAQLVVAAGVLLLVHGPEDLLRVPLLQVLGELVAALLLLPLLRGAWHQGSIAQGAAALRGVGTITLSRLLRTIIVSSDVLLLSFLANDHQVGLYTAAYRVCFFITAIATSAHVVFLPLLTRVASDPAAGGEVLTRSFWLSYFLAVPLVVGGILVAPELLTLLFGASFRAGGDAFRLLLASTGLLFLHGTLQNVFLVRDRLRLQAWIIGVAAGVNLVLNFLLIPRYGLVGSALATLIAEGIILTAALAAVRSWGWRPTLAPLGRPTVAAVIMAVVLLLLPAAVPVGVRIGAGGLTYLAILGLAGGFPPEVKRLLRFSGT